MSILQQLINYVIVPFGLVYFGVAVGGYLLFVLAVFISAIPMGWFFVEAYAFYLVFNYIFAPMVDIQHITFLVSCALVMLGNLLERIMFFEFPKNEDNDSVE